MIEYELLAAPGSVGYYESIEVTSIFLHRRSDHENLNLYTLCVFEEQGGTAKPTPLTARLQPLTSDLGLGIYRARISLAEARDSFARLNNGDPWQLGLSHLAHRETERVPRFFVGYGELLESSIAKILKPNVFGGSHVIEFFCSDKSDFAGLRDKPEILDTLRGAIAKHLPPIRLDMLPDRWGSYIFQFPVSVIAAIVGSASNPERITVDLKHHPLFECRDIHATAASYFDGDIHGYAAGTFGTEDRLELMIGSSRGDNFVSVFRSDLGLLLHHERFQFMEGITLNMNTGTRYGNTRTVSIPKGLDRKGTLVTGEIELLTHQTIPVNQRGVDYMTHARQRAASDKKDRLQVQREFMQYGRYDQTDRLSGFVVALTDIRGLISQHGASGVWLWDPYLEAVDVLRTLYFNPTSNARMRAITSFSRRRQGTVDAQDQQFYVDWRDQQGDSLKTNSNGIGIDFEFRCQHGNHGYTFHDRFLIFPRKSDELYSEPKVWSLGTSINSLGGSHHVITRVAYPEPVAIAFEELWTNLAHDDCLIFQSGTR